MNCILMREIPLRSLLSSFVFLSHIFISILLRSVYRVWDTYLAEGEQFGTLHIYVCAAFLIHWSDELKKMDFQVPNSPSLISPS